MCIYNSTILLKNIKLHVYLGNVENKNYSLVKCSPRPRRRRNGMHRRRNGAVSIEGGPPLPHNSGRGRRIRFPLFKPPPSVQCISKNTSPSPYSASSIIPSPSISVASSSSSSHFDREMAVRENKERNEGTRPPSLTRPNFNSDGAGLSTRHFSQRIE